MSTITVRNIDERVKRELRMRAAQRGHSMEEEVREILSRVVETDRAPEFNIAASIMKRFAPLGGVELNSLPRDKMRKPPKFD
jgi:plasmid stability protein